MLDNFSHKYYLNYLKKNEAITHLCIGIILDFCKVLLVYEDTPTWITWNTTSLSGN
jgi:hypothetical protein